MVLSELNRPSLAPALDRLIAEHGLWRVIAAMLRRLARGQAPPPAQAEAAMPDWLRRDIGLPVLPPARPALPPRLLP